MSLPGPLRVGVGVHPHQDPAVIDDFERVEVRSMSPCSTTTPRSGPRGVAFFIDGQHVKTVAQAIAYPMQFMLGLYEFPTDPGAEPAEDRLPKAGNGVVRPRLPIPAAERRGERARARFGMMRPVRWAHPQRNLNRYVMTSGCRRVVSTSSSRASSRW